ncbi:uncharacterized protein LOC120349737 [Nilaparvata lugens]|uniref:uncharacterized protein LOC120349737 n=1 Tax=Nilaparvata lugens TaxID=108931 RepID=UPI00193E24BB|nr:uncharacterized protein LOC120349737 [Nilaparvata lugens]
MTADCGFEGSKTDTRLNWRGGHLFSKNLRLLQAGSAVLGGWGDVGGRRSGLLFNVAATSLDSWCPARGGTGCPSMPWMTSSAWRVMSSGSSRRSAGCGATSALTFSDETHL